VLSDSRQHTLNLAALTVSVAVFGATAACTIDNVGLLAAYQTHADGAVVIDVYSVGGDLRTSGGDAGLSAGAVRRSYVFSSDGVPPADDGWHFLTYPLPPSDPVALNATVIGLDVRAAAPEPGITLGYRATTVLARVAADQSVTQELAYWPDDPKRTRLRICKEPALC